MITFISGEVNSGKTTRLRDLYKLEIDGAGYFCEKIIGQNGNFVGYDIVNIKNVSEKIAFIRTNDSISKKNWNQKFTFSRFSFSDDGFQLANQIFETAMSESSKSFFIDEIGPLELQGQGFSALFVKAIKSFNRLYVVTRYSCLEAVIKNFDIKNYEIILLPSKAS